jgi:uncharacterized protein
MPTGAQVKLTQRQLRSHAVLHTFSGAATLRAALERLEFVQADPIRAPARAQDLILRQRVTQYRAGDLERHYPELGIEEGFLYAYGFLTRPLWELRHPPNRARLSRRQQRLLDAVAERGEVHPEDLQPDFGSQRARNAWGSYSSAVKLALEALHQRGLLRIARRKNGIRIYAPRVSAQDRASNLEVFQALVASVTNILAPISEQCLRAITFRFARSLRCDVRAVLAAQRETELLASGTFDGVTYLWPGPGSAYGSAPAGDEPQRVVRLLAPFDPLVWDRGRFEHLWGWAYRFEAYTPVAKRVRGYYALPLLWGDRVIGWANLTRTEKELSVELGFSGRRPGEREFRLQLDAEIERMRTFLRAPSDG